MFLNWKLSGALLACTFLLSAFLVKPIGVSTHFVIVDGIIANSVKSDLTSKNVFSKSGYSSSNSYLNKSGGKYAKSVNHPLSYGLVFVLFMALGGFIGKYKSLNFNLREAREQSNQVPEFHIANFGNTKSKRYLICFLGGVIVLYGARLAGGCTSGHMMSGMMQTSLSGILFTLAAFPAAIITSFITYRK